MKYIINQNQCGFLMKDGIFIKTLYCGKYWYPGMLGYQVVIEKMEGCVGFGTLPAEVLLQDQTFADKVLHIKIPEGHIGILRLNGVVQQVLTEPVYLYWNNWNRYDYELLDMREPKMKAEITKSYLAHIPLKYYKKIEIKTGETGVLYFDNQMVGELAAGTYFYWTYAKDVVCQVIDLRARSIEINGQEILTADRIGIRVNLLCTYRVTQVKRMLETIKNQEAQIYACVQLVVREYIGKYRLDEILEQKEEISGFICTQLKEVQDDYCIEFLTVGIKDIILPGEIREIMNTVLIAERKAQANVITRREEVASTRSLLNTAKLMDENKTLYKLKELECLERICMQVGNINVAGSGALLEQLRELMGGFA